MAFQNAKGNHGNTAGPQRTPAPDAISSPRSGGGQGYGSNGPVGNASSVEPGKRVLSPLAQNLESSVDDPALQTVIAKGTAKNEAVSSQLRKIADSNVAPSYGMALPKKAPTVPGKSGA